MTPLADAARALLKTMDGAHVSYRAVFKPEMDDLRDALRASLPDEGAIGMSDANRDGLARPWRLVTFVLLKRLGGDVTTTPDEWDDAIRGTIITNDPVEPGRIRIVPGRGVERVEPADEGAKGVALKDWGDDEPDEHEAELSRRATGLPVELLDAIDAYGTVCCARKDHGETWRNLVAAIRNTTANGDVREESACSTCGTQVRENTMSQRLGGPFGRNRVYWNKAFVEDLVADGDVKLSDYDECPDQFHATAIRNRALGSEAT